MKGTSGGPSTARALAPARLVPGSQQETRLIGSRAQQILFGLGHCAKRSTSSAAAPAQGLGRRVGGGDTDRSAIERRQRIRRLLALQLLQAQDEAQLVAQQSTGAPKPTPPPPPEPPHPIDVLTADIPKAAPPPDGDVITTAGRRRRSGLGASDPAPCKCGERKKTEGAP